MIQRNGKLAYLYRSDYEDVMGEQDQLYVADLESSEIYTLDGAGIIIWDILDKPLNIIQLLHELASIYGLDQETIAPSVLSFIDSLLAQGLIEQTPEP